MRDIYFKESRPENQLMVWRETIAAGDGATVVGAPVIIESLSGSITVGVTSGTARVETTQADEAVIRAGEAIWAPWPKGDVTETATDSIADSACVIGLRVVVVGGAGGSTFEIQAAFGPR